LFVKCLCIIWKSGIGIINDFLELQRSEPKPTDLMLILYWLLGDNYNQLNSSIVVLCCVSKETKTK